VEEQSRGLSCRLISQSSAMVLAPCGQPSLDEGEKRGVHLTKGKSVELASD